VDVINRRNEEQALERKNSWSLDRMLVDCIDNPRIIVGKADNRSLPLIMP
jgi:hypothetical protein